MSFQDILASDNSKSYPYNLWVNSIHTNQAINNNITPYLITASTDTNLTGAQAASTFICSTSNFDGHILTMATGFAQELYTALNSPAIPYSITVTFSAGDLAPFTLAITDPNIITTNCYTINNDSSINSGAVPILFVLTNISPPQFTMYG